MFPLLKFFIRVLANKNKIVDKDSCRTFLRELIVLMKPLVAKTDTKLDETLLKHIEFVLNNDALFDYVYRLIYEQFQTSEILFESVEANTIFNLCKPADGQNYLESLRANKTQGLDNPTTVNPALVVSLVTQIISIINAIKKK